MHSHGCAGLVSTAPGCPVSVPGQGQGSCRPVATRGFCHGIYLQLWFPDTPGWAGQVREFHWPEGSQHSLSLLPGAGSHPVGPLLSMPGLSLPAFVRLLRGGRRALAWPTVSGSRRFSLYPYSRASWPRKSSGSCQDPPASWDTHTCQPGLGTKKLQSSQCDSTTPLLVPPGPWPCSHPTQIFP